MSLIESLFSLPAEMDQWIVLFYVALVLAGARIVEFVAKKHYERARNFAVQGFEYLAEEDQYRCPEGEHLKLLKRDNENRLAIYQIRTSCQFCRLKESCAPHSDARQVTRSLATWAEAEVGKFHRRISAIMLLAADARLRSLPAAVGWQARNGPLRNRAGRKCRFPNP